MIKSETLLQELSRLTIENKTSIAHLKSLTPDILNWKENNHSWSILECIEHLNRYGEFYIPEITKKMAQSNHKNSPIFKSNWLGKYFSNSVAYKEKLNKMNTFKSMNPINSTLSVDTLNEFIKQQDQIIELLHKAKMVNLDKTRTAISITKLITLKLGDTFRVLIYHNQRHIKQAEKVAIKAINQEKNHLIKGINE